MRKTLRGKKKPKALTRVELTRAMGVGLTSIDRLIAFGLKPSGHRGRAKVYRIAAARRLAERLAPAETVAADILIADHHTHAEDLHDRRRLLLEAWVADAAWLPRWRAVVALVAKVTLTWPALLAERIGSTPREQARRLATADGPLVPASPPWPGWKDADEFLRDLLAEPGTWPHAEAEVLAHAAPRVTARDEAERAWLVRRAALRRGVVVQDGRWYRPPPAIDGTASPAALADWSAQQAGRNEAVRALDLAEAKRQVGPPLMRPLLDDLSRAAAESMAALAAALQPPAPEALSQTPKAVDAARAAWREARAAFRRVRVAVRRSHHRRAAVAERIERATKEFSMGWWQAVPRIVHEHAGDHAGALAAVAELRRLALTRLAALEDLVPEERVPQTEPTPRRPARHKRTPGV